MAKKITQAVILAGGLGTRLRPLTDTIPKPMVPINGRPFLEYLIELLRENGITDVVLLLGYLPEKIIEHFGDGTRHGLRIHHSVSDVVDDTGTRLKKAEVLLDDHFLLMYGDNYWPMNFENMIARFQKNGLAGQMTVYNNRDGGGEYGLTNQVRVEDDGRIGHYGAAGEGVGLNAVDMGFFIMPKEVLALIPSDKNVSFQKTVLPILIERKQLGAYPTDHPYYFVTSLAQLPTVEKYLSARKVIFLDRDGVINRKMAPHTYVTQWKEFEFLPTSLVALRLLTEAGYEIYIISNQRGISRGLMTEDDLLDIHGKMLEKIQGSGGKISDIYFCPHGTDDGCFCRKPKPGMFFRAARDHHINLTKALFIGDAESDRIAGEAVGCKTIIIEPNGDLLGVVRSILS